MIPPLLFARPVDNVKVRFFEDGAKHCRLCFSDPGEKLLIRSRPICRIARLENVSAFKARPTSTCSATPCRACGAIKPPCAS
jgi:hypothetical protein